MFGQQGTIRLRIDQVAPGTTDASDTTEILYCTDADRTQARVAVNEPSRADSPDWQQGQWYEFSEITRTHAAGDAMFSVTPTDGRCARIDPPAMESPSGAATTATHSVAQLGERPDRLGLTVVAVPASGGSAISPGAPESYEVTAVCLDAFNAATDPDVYHREAADSHDERLLLEHVIEDLTRTDAETLVTWGGGVDSIELLASRHQQLRDGDILDQTSADVFDGFYYADLSRLGARHSHDDPVEMAQSLGLPAEYPRFDPDTLESDPSEWRADWDLEQTPLTSATETRLVERDYRALVDSHLTGSSTTPAALGECLKGFASAQLEPLQSVSSHDVAARLGCPQLTSGAVQL